MGALLSGKGTAAAAYEDFLKRIPTAAAAGDVYSKRLAVQRGAPMQIAANIGRTLESGQERLQTVSPHKAVAGALRRAGYTVVKIDAVGHFLADIASLQPDVVFVALHGTFGEDGQVQQLLEDHGIPYTGSGIRSSRMAMNKVRAKMDFNRAGVPTPRWRVLTAPCATEELDSVEEMFGLPLVVKPIAEGSSVGVSLVRSRHDWPQAMLNACVKGDPCSLSHEDATAILPVVLAEQYILGRELTVAVMEGTALPIVEMIYKAELFDYDAKYSAGITTFDDAPVLDPEIEAAVKDAAVRAYVCLGCKGVARVDLMMSEDQAPFVLEVNTIPGMTDVSLVPRAARRAGIGFEQLTSMIVEQGLQAHRAAAETATQPPTRAALPSITFDTETSVGETRETSA